MATCKFTPGPRIAGSKFSTKHYKPRNNDHLLINNHPCLSPFFDESLAELMETLRLHMNAVLRLPLPAQKRSRLVRLYWELEYLVKEVRLLIDPAALLPLFNEAALSP